MKNNKKNYEQHPADAYTFTISGVKYAINIEAIRDFCFPNGNSMLKEQELTESYEWDEEEREMQITNRITRDVKGGENQCDMVVYDLVKLFIVRLLDNASLVREFELDFSTSLAINTLLKYGMIEVISKEN